MNVMKKIETAKAPAAIGPYSQALALGNLLFTSGQIPLSPETGEVAGATIAEQTEQALSNLGAVLEAGGSNFSLVLKTTCFLSDMANFAAFNEVYAKYFSEKPARSTVAVKALPKNVLVEVEAIAAIPE
jgi:2-iminobutanoate/2-iminopropanoate deaminase